MAQRRYRLEHWFAVPDGMGCIDWDCESLVVVVDDDGKIYLMQNHSGYLEGRVNDMFPNAAKLSGVLRIQRGKEPEFTGEFLDKDKLILSKRYAGGIMV